VAARRAIAGHLARTGVAARVEPGCGTGRWRVRYEVREAPNVAIVLPTGGRLELLRPCLEGLFARTSYPHYEIVIIDNSKSDAVRQYVESLHEAKISYLDQRGRPFNYSALNNLAVHETTAPLLLFLNDDITLTDEEWLTALVEQGQRPTVGAVGARLLYPSGLIQHAGVVMGLWQNTGHAFRNLPDTSEAYFGFPQVMRNCSAVTAACMMTKRDLFLRLGGFDEVHLAVAFQDVDYCLRVREAGLYVVYTPHCTLIHHEAVTKAEKIANPREVGYMQTRWAAVIASDPFYSPHLARNSEDYGLRLA
jgi:GT2 family glycosyltransferase